MIPGMAVAAFIAGPYGGGTPFGGIDANTSLCLHGDGADGSTTFVDSSSNGFTPTVRGDARIRTAQSVFDGASMYFDGTGDALSYASNAAFGVGTGSFTVDFWLRFDVASGGPVLMSNGTGGGLIIFMNGTTLKVSRKGVGDDVTYNWSPSTGTWYHVAVVRNGTNLRIYINGVSVASATSSSNYGSSDTLHIGFDGGSLGYLSGYIDEFRFSKGVARWTTGFTPPDRPYTTA